MNKIAADVLRMASRPPYIEAGAEAEVGPPAGSGGPESGPGSAGGEAPITRETHFFFVYFGIRFDGTIRPTDGGVLLVVDGNLGPLPFSLLSADTRRNTLAILNTGKYVEDIDFSISPEQHIRLLDTRALPQPATARNVVAGVAMFLATAKPYLELIAAELEPITISGLKTPDSDDGRKRPEGP